MAPGSAEYVGNPWSRAQPSFSGQAEPTPSLALSRGASLVLMTLVSLGLWAGIWAAIGSLISGGSQ